MSLQFQQFFRQRDLWVSVDYSIVFKLRDHVKWGSDQLTFVAEDNARIVGAAALECYDDGALLRSVVVEASARGLGIGKRLTMAAVEQARSLELPAVYLLTTTAAAFFPKLGFELTTREAVPPSVRQSIEFQSACPGSANVLTLRLR